MISYEFPLNERIRTLLRMESLYQRVQFYLSKEHALEHHAALLSLFEILDVAGRADLKSDLIQELERQRQSLGALRANPAISEAALNQILGDIDRAAQSLQQTSGKTGQELRENEWLMAISSVRQSLGESASSTCLPITIGCISSRTYGAATWRAGLRPSFRSSTAFGSSCVYCVRAGA